MGRSEAVRSRFVRAARVAVAALLLTPVLVLTGPGAALACSCALATTAEHIGWVDTVAAGELTSIEPRTDGPTDAGSQLTYTATLQTTFKGDPQNPLVFHSSSMGSDCGLEGMVVGREYVFFVRGDESGLCDGTGPLTPTLVSEVEAVTGPGTPAPPTAEDEPTESAAAEDPASDQADGSALWSVLGAAALALIVLGGLLWQSRRSNLSREQSAGRLAALGGSDPEATAAPRRRDDTT